MRAVCIKCWDADSLVKLHCDGSGYFECEGCGETFHCAEVREVLSATRERWEKLIKWAEAYPGGVAEPTE